MEKAISDPQKLSIEIQDRALQIADKFASKDGLFVNYNKLRKSRELEDFVFLCSSLNFISLEILGSLPESQRMSIFVNIYNALIMHATCVLGAPDDNPSSRTAFFNGSTGARYAIGGHFFSPDDIEHGILRANWPHPSQPPNSRSFFPAGDLRASLALSCLDARIHFMLNCGASSCPPIRVLSSDNIDAALSAAAAGIV